MSQTRTMYVFQVPPGLPMPVQGSIMSHPGDGRWRLVTEVNISDRSFGLGVEPIDPDRDKTKAAELLEQLRRQETERQLEEKWKP